MPPSQTQDQSVSTHTAPCTILFFHLIATCFLVPFPRLARLCYLETWTQAARILISILRSRMQIVL